MIHDVLYAGVTRSDSKDRRANKSSERVKFDPALRIHHQTGEFTMETATLIVMLALLEYFGFTAKVGSLRAKTGVKAPSCTGNDTFERAFRVQQNTLEQLIIFIPATYAFAFYVSSTWVWIPGAAFIIGRFIYFNEYTNNPDSRLAGMLITLLTNLALVLGVLIKLVINMF